MFLAEPLHYQNDDLYMDGVRLEDIANDVGTPAYVYSANYIRSQVAHLQAAFATIEMDIHYSVKANSNLSILRLFHDLGCGFDIVSAGELGRVQAAGGDASRVIFSGVGKRTDEIDLALKLGIQCFNVESAAELARLAARADILGVLAPISIRVNPNVDAQTHPYISTGLEQNKFGVPLDAAVALYQQAHQHPALVVRGIDCHIGSQISNMAPLLEALTSVLELVDELDRLGIELAHLDLGGGMGITYRDEPALDIAAYGAGVAQMMGGRTQRIQLEPGRLLTANAGVLLTRVEYLKPAQAPHRPNFAIVDAAMNDLIRPALYQAYHEVLNTKASPGGKSKVWQVVGPVCESGDFLAHDRNLDIDSDSLLAVASSGAYGMVQASNYNSRGRPCEVLVDGDQYRVIRQRETLTDMIRLELEP